MIRAKEQTCRLVVITRNRPAYSDAFEGSVARHCSWWRVRAMTLRKHAYSNILKILPPKNENFSDKNSDISQISAQNIDCGYSLEPPRWGGSNEYPQSMFLNRNKKNNVYPCKPHFYYIKMGFKGVNIIKACFRDDVPHLCRLWLLDIRNAYFEATNILNWCKLFKARHGSCKKFCH